MDGTLLNSKKEISENNKKAIQKLFSKGHKIVIATARLPRSIDKKIKSLDVTTDNIYYNGALVKCNDGTNFTNSIENNLFVEIYKSIKENDSGAIISIEENDKWFSCQEYDYKKEFSVSEGPEILNETDFLNKRPNKILINRYKTSKYIKEQFSHSCNVIETDSSTLIQIMSKDASKENSIKEIAEKYAFSRNKIYCFGDDHNDIGMFNYCANGVAMGNAIDELKKVAKYVTDTNDNDGIAKFILNNRYF